VALSRAKQYLAEENTLETHTLGPIHVSRTDPIRADETPSRAEANLVVPVWFRFDMCNVTELLSSVQGYGFSQGSLRSSVLFSSIWSQGFRTGLSSSVSSSDLVFSRLLNYSSILLTLPQFNLALDIVSIVLVSRISQPSVF